MHQHTIDNFKNILLKLIYLFMTFFLSISVFELEVYIYQIFTSICLYVMG